MRTFNLITLAALIFTLSSFFSCDNSKKSPTESQLPPVDEVIIVGTNVDTSFLSDGKFG